MNKIYLVMGSVYDGVKDQTAILGAYTDEDRADEIVDNINKETIKSICGIDMYIVKAWVLEINTNEKVNIAIY